MENRNNDINYISEKVISSGYRLTTQRYEIIKTIYENNKHMNADEIYAKIKDKNIGISTVYRSLLILEHIGILKRINAINVSYYELQDIGEVHIHAKCRKCNEIIDIKKERVSNSLKSLIKNIKKEYKVTINSTSIMLLGICGKCENDIKLNSNANRR